MRFCTKSSIGLVHVDVIFEAKNPYQRWGRPVRLLSNVNMQLATCNYTSMCSDRDTSNKQEKNSTFVDNSILEFHPKAYGLLRCLCDCTLVHVRLCSLHRFVVWRALGTFVLPNKHACAPTAANHLVVYKQWNGVWRISAIFTQWLLNCGQYAGQWLCGADNPNSQDRIRMY